MALRAFEAAARLGSFKAAAAELGRTASAISHHVGDLEMEFGYPLFRRGHRSVVLTSQGETLFSTLSPAFRDILGAYTQAKNGKRIRLSAAPLFAAKFILANIHDLQVQIPGIGITLDSSLDKVDIKGHADLIALRFGPKPRIGDAVLISESHLVAVTSRKRANSIQDMSDMQHAPLLTLVQQPLLWAEAFSRLGLAKPENEIAFDSIEGVQQAALAGHGIALLPNLVCLDELKSGALVQIHMEPLVHTWRYWVTAEKGTLAASYLDTIAKWLTGQVQLACLQP